MSVFKCRRHSGFATGHGTLGRY